MAAVDAETSAFVERVGATVPVPPPAPTVPAGHVEVLTTTDTDEEVRHTVRSVVNTARSGVPFARMAVVWPVDKPYARLAEHHLDMAGVPWNGRPGTLVTERLVPRFLLDLLRLDRRGLRRRDVFDFLADLPVRGPDGRRVSVARWERVARLAGVSRDEHWAPRLGALTASLRQTATGRGSTTPTPPTNSLRSSPTSGGISGARAGHAPGRSGPIGASARCSIAWARRCSTNSTRPSDWPPITPAGCSTGCDTSTP